MPAGFANLEKKLDLRAAEQGGGDVARARQAWASDPAGVAGIGPERLVFLDECGVLTNMARLYVSVSPLRRVDAVP